MYQKLMLVGRLARDPEMRYTPTGTAVTNFSVPSSRKYKNANGETVEETTWFRVVVWGKQAENVNQYCQKGSMVLVEGTLIPDEKTGSPRVYEKKDGTFGASFEVRADSVRFLSSRNDTTESNGENEGLGEADAPF